MTSIAIIFDPHLNFDCKLLQKNLSKKYPTNSSKSIGNDEVKFYLSDFGLTDKQIGGTPIFASPEALDGTIFEKTDVYSLGITWFFILMQNVEDFLKFLFWPINDDSQGSPDSRSRQLGPFRNQQREHNCP